MHQVQKSDSELLEAFVSRGREHAFETLVQRYGALVHGACLRILVHSHDAEDAAQAVFLVLAKKAAALRRRKSIAGWLHRTATNVSLNIRKAIRQQQKRLQEAVSMKPAHDPDRGEWDKLAPRLDSELNRLPEKYRVPLILHHMEGLTKEEVGAQLGWNEGTVSSRLHRGRRLLQSRLQRVGVVLSVEALLALIAGNALAAPLPAAAAVALPRAAVLLAQGKVTASGVVQARVAELTEEALRSLFRNALGKAVAGIAGSVVVVTAGGFALHEVLDRTPPPVRESILAEAAAPAGTGSRISGEPERAVIQDGDPEPICATSPVEERPGAIAPVRTPGAAGPLSVSPRSPRERATSTATASADLESQGTVILYSLARHGDPERASCVFGLVTLESQDRADRDLLFGPDGKDSFTVSLQPDDRSRLLDLGPVPWNRIARETGLIARLARHGTPSLDAHAGHAYLGRIQDGDSDFHVLFRVEELVPGDWCVLSWAVIDPVMLPDVEDPDGQVSPTRRISPEAPGRWPLPPGRASPAIRVSREVPKGWKRMGPEPYQIRSGTATLLARVRHQDFEKATFCFRFGLRDDPGCKITRNDWSIEFGNDGRVGSDDFKVNMHGGDRCRILDLGELSWDQVDEATLPALPVTAYTGKQLRDLDRARVVPGHVYLVHCVSLLPRRGADGARVLEVDHDFYAAFRVESHVPDDTCTFSWRLISAPGTGEEPFAR